MIDAHCHLDFPVFDDDRPQVIAESKQNGIKGWHLPGTQQTRWSRQLDLASEYNMDASLGLHPYFLRPDQSNHLSDLERRIHRHKTQLCALGEIGLDSVVDIDSQYQLSIFNDQVVLAQSLGLPIVVHHRKTHNEILSTLKRNRFTQGGLIHAFSGSEQIARGYVDRGFVLGIGGLISYPRGEKLRRLIAALPSSCIVLETDSPDMPFYGHQGKRNSPAQALIAANVVADVWQVSLADVARITTQNYLRTFKYSRYQDGF